MFKNLTDEEITTLYRTIKSGRDAMYAAFSKSFAQCDYNAVYDMSAILGELHAENAIR